MWKWRTGYRSLVRDFVPAGNDPSDCMQVFGDCREGQYRPLRRGI